MLEVEAVEALEDKEQAELVEAELVDKAQHKALREQPILAAEVAEVAAAMQTTRAS